METTQTDSAISSLQDFDLLQSSAPDPLRSTLRAKPGRPEPKTLTELVRARTNNGADLVNVLVAIVRGRYGATVSNRLRALELLADRGWGRAVQSLDLASSMPADSQLTVTVTRIAARGSSDLEPAELRNNDLGPIAGDLDGVIEATDQGGLELTDQQRNLELISWSLRS